MNSQKIILKNALIIYAGIVIYFLITKILGLDEVSELRFLNFVFVLWGVNKAIKTNMDINKENLYINNFSVGIATSILSVTFTILGLIIYVGFIEPSFMSVLENSSFWGKDLNLIMVIFALAIEGIASSVICSFVLMQYYKNYSIPEVIL